MNSVFITFAFIGFHRWADAPDEVYYLRSMHRHLFKVRIDISVEHREREIEFHMLQRAATDWVVDSFDINAHGEAELGSASCESFAAHLLEWLQKTYPDRPYYRIEVSEDGECGSTVEARP